MLNKVTQEALNEQIKHEFFSAYQYLAMAAYCEALNLQGFAHWMRLQAQEELGHGLKIYDFVIDRGGRVKLQAIDQPEGDFSSPLAVFEQALAHEQQVTSLIDQLYALAVKEHDYASQVFLNWFVDEQVEEEKNASHIVETLKMIGANKPALLMFDRELGQRQAEADSE